ncbi:MAG: transcription elongation factor GreA [Candidatus Levybacteria bacterium]|nr:transcription elongation factor GreA [Candidatus Levybacteria bacterium]
MDTKKKIFVTKQGLEEMKKELQDHEKVKRPQVLERVSQARAMGDLSENSEYTAAREELSLIDTRIEELSDMMKKVEIIDEGKASKAHSAVQLGSRVTVTINGKKEVFELVGEWEADPMEKKISHESPLGKALIGKALNDKIEVEAPAGKILYHIVEIS